VKILREHQAEDDTLFTGLEYMKKVLAILKNLSKKWQFYIMNWYI